MPLTTLTAVHTVTAYPLEGSSSAVMGTTFARGTGVTKQCRVSHLSAREISEYAARGMHVDHELYFSTDPEINNNYEIDFNGITIRVDGIYPESDGSGTNKLWVVVGHEKTSRKAIA